jgi:hypothetical protein
MLQTDQSRTMNEQITLPQHEQLKLHRNTSSQSETVVDDDDEPELEITQPDEKAERRSSCMSPSSSGSFTIHEIPQDDDNKTSGVSARPTKKSVRFAETTSCEGGHVPYWTELTHELCNDLWYQPTEITSLKQQARYVLTHRSTASADDLSGLEKFNTQRAVWKRSAVHYTLAAQQHRAGDESFLRKVSQRCTGWARATALKQGFRDYCAVHDPLACLFDEGDEENYNDCFFSDVPCDCINKKRQSDDKEDDDDGDGQSPRPMKKQRVDNNTDSDSDSDSSSDSTSVEGDAEKEDDFAPIPVFF